MELKDLIQTGFSIMLLRIVDKEIKALWFWNDLIN